MANAAKISVRSAFMPSTAMSIEPSLPRSALPLPHTETKVTVATQTRLAQMEMVTKVCSIVLAVGLFGGRSISTNVVSVKPAMIAAWAPTAEKFLLKRLSSFSRSWMARCLTVVWRSSLSAASMVAGRR